jgi:lipopolysaccharide export LptBFGC system permease protein LptF
MKKLQAYVVKGTLKALVPAFAALVLLMIVGLCMQLLHDGLDVVRLSGLLPPIVAYCVPIVLPSAFLTAVIMTFGRLSADNELVAVRAAGLSLSRVVCPVLVTGLVLSLVAAYFQFETVPWARGAIKALKYKALKQVLLDKVALSWKRQFSFPPAHIQYEDFKDGQMLRVIMLEVREKRPRTIITAATSIVREPQATEADLFGAGPAQGGGRDRRGADRAEAVLFEMKDCVITRFDVQESAPARSIAAEWVRYGVRVAPSTREVLARTNNLPLGPLLGELRRLRRKLQGQPRFENPEEARTKAQQEQQRLNGWLAELDRALESARGRLQKYAEQEPRRHQQTIERNGKLMTDAQQRLQVLQQQQAECVRRLNELQAGSGDLERLVELQKQHRELLGQIDVRKKEVESLAAGVEEGQRLLKEAQDRAAEVRAEVGELEQRKSDLTRRSDAVNAVVRRASDQYELRSITLWIHKRLAQAASVFVFALVGIPLGILPSRRSVMVAFGMSFGIVLFVFYPFLIVGEIAADAAAVPVGLAMWAGDGFMLIIGAVLMAKVLRR